MSQPNLPTIIIGAGLTGLTLAHHLQRAGKDFLLFEARNRTGGRILTSRTDNGGPLEMGATWLGKKHTHLVHLLCELGIKTFEQVTGGRAVYEAIPSSPPQIVQLPHNDEPSYRIAGGSDVLIGELQRKISAGRIHLDEAVLSLREQPDHLEVTTTKDGYRADKVVSTLPPHLFVTNLSVSPALPNQLLGVARKTHTWMGESIKVGLRYATPFWRETGAPGGTIFSNVGPVTEMYDHTDVDNKHFALKGFLSGTYHSVSRVERREMVLGQLRRYYGTVVKDHLAYEESIWRNDPHTFVAYEDRVLPHQHNGHPVFRKEYLNGRLMLAGSETAVSYPGYMDGAVQSALRVAGLLLAE